MPRPGVLVQSCSAAVEGAPGASAIHVSIGGASGGVAAGSVLELETAAKRLGLVASILPISPIPPCMPTLPAPTISSKAGVTNAGAWCKGGATSEAGGTLTGGKIVATGSTTVIPGGKGTPEPGIIT